MRNLLAVVVVLASTRAAFAFTGVYSSDTSNVRIEVAEVPGHPEVLLVGWDHLPGAVPTGAMIYQRDHGTDEDRYFAVGGGGPAALVDRGGATLVEGTIVPMLAVVVDDPQHPLRVTLERGHKIDVAALSAKYAAFEHLIAAGAGRSTIEAAIVARAAKANRACGSKIAPQIQWADFAKAGKLALASQAIAIYDAIEATCADKDYRAALQAVTAMRVELRGDGLAFEVKHGELGVQINDTSWNPRETAAQWLEKNL
jgi:hypothetical protein